MASTALILWIKRSKAAVLSSFQDEVPRNPQSVRASLFWAPEIFLWEGSSEVLKSRCNGRAVVRFTGKISEKKLGCSPNWRLIGRCCWDGGTFRTNKYNYHGLSKYPRYYADICMNPEHGRESWQTCAEIATICPEPSSDIHCMRSDAWFLPKHCSNA